MGDELLRSHLREIIDRVGPPNADLRARIAAGIPPGRVNRLRGPLHGVLGWVLGLIAFALVAGIIGILMDLRAARPQPTGTAPSPSPLSQPRVNVSAFRGQGKLAFLSGGRLFLLDGGMGVLTAVADGDTFGPAWSPSGRWLLFFRAGQSWLASADGSSAQTTLRAGAAAWSPVADTLAGSDREGLWVMQAGDSPRTLVPGPVGQPRWSPDGAALAYTVVDQARNGHLFTVPATGGTPREVPLAIPAVPGSTGLILAGWWSNSQGLLFWVNGQNSASLMADGLPLQTISISGGAPRTLVHMLVNPSWLAWSADRLLVVEGGDRLLWSNRTLALCDVQAASCQPLPQPSGALAFDPAVALDGSGIAFVRATTASSYRFDPEAILARYATHTLWVADAGGANARQVLSAGAGVQAPLWSKDGRHVLYVRDNALWLVAPAGGAPVRVAEPLLAPRTPETYYGQFSWQKLIAWDR